MNKPINPKVHGVLDYGLGIFLMMSPALFGFTGTIAATVLYVMGGLHLIVSLMTAYPLGVLKTIPFTVHAGIEFSGAIFLILAPWLFGFSGLELARNLYVISGVGLVGVWALTDYTGRGARKLSRHSTPADSELPVADRRRRAA